MQLIEPSEHHKILMGDTIFKMVFSNAMLVFRRCNGVDSVIFFLPKTAVADFPASYVYRRLSKNLTKLTTRWAHYYC